MKKLTEKFMGSYETKKITSENTVELELLVIRDAYSVQI